MITYRETTHLNQQELSQIGQLIEVIHEEDQSFRDPYLSNQFNFFSEMPAFILVYRQQQLVGLATLYADGEPGERVEVYVGINPADRRQGLAASLIQRMKQILDHYGYPSMVFLSERTFLNRHPGFLQQTKLYVNPVSEWQMVCTGSAVVMKKSPLLELQELQSKDIADLLESYLEAFPESTPAEAERYLTETIASSQETPYIYKHGGTIIGYCAVNHGEYDYLFGLFIKHDQRGKGYATSFLQDLIEHLQIDQDHPLKLAVESDNPGAYHLYCKTGFICESEVVYLEKQVA